MWTDRRALVRLLGVLCLLTATAHAETDLGTIAVLPAVAKSGGGRAQAQWGLGWQYLLQERLRNLAGVDVAPLQNAPELIEQYQAGKLDVSTIAARNKVAAALDADLLVAPEIIKGGEEWELTVSLVRPMVDPKPIAEVPSITGNKPFVMADQLVTATLKALVPDATVVLSQERSEEARTQESQVLFWSLGLWPFGGKADAARGQLEKALDILGRTAAQPANAWQVFDRYATAAIAAGKASEALKVILRWSGPAANPRSQQAALILGRVLSAADQDKEAITALTKAATLSKGSLPAVQALAEVYRREGNIDQALAQYDQAIKLWPSFRSFQMLRGQLALDAHRDDVAIKSFTAAIAKGPKDPDAYAGLIQALIEANRGADAWPQAQRLAELQPDDPAAMALFVQAGVAAGQFDAVKDAATKLAAARADDAQAQGLLGLVAAQTKDCKTAETALTAAIKLDPKNLSYYRTLADCRTFADPPDYTGAATILAQALKIAPDVERPGLQTTLAQIYLYAQKYAEALKAVQEVETLLPKSAEARYLEARIHLYAGDPTKATDALKAATDLDTGAAGPGQQVIADLEQVEKDTPRFDNLKLVLGYLYQLAGRNRDARRKYVEYLANAGTAPQVDWVKQQLAQLDAAGTG